MAKNKIVIVGAKVIGKNRGRDIVLVEVGKAYQVDVDNVPFGGICEIAFVPGRDNDPDHWKGTPEEDGKNPKTGTAHIQNVVLPDFPGDDYTGVLQAFYVPAEGEVDELGSIQLRVKDLILPGS